MPRALTLTVAPEQDGARVDTLLRRELGLSAAVVRRAKWYDDGITLDGVRVFTTAEARAGQVLAIRIDDRADGELVPTPGPVDIVYEDEDLLVVNKAAGVPVHPSKGHFDDTLGNFLTYYYRNKGVPFTYRPVNRLDHGTTGLMAVAKNAHCHERLKRQLHTGDFRRIYLAVCEGAPDPARGAVEAPIGPCETSLVRRQVRPDGQSALTRYETLKTENGRSLLRLELFTGRTHQIRVHMAYLGCPLTGDFLYGQEDRERISRPALHSAELFLTHPVTRRQIRLTAPLPEDMQKLLSL